MNKFHSQQAADLGLFCLLIQSQEKNIRAGFGAFNPSSKKVYLAASDFTVEY